MLRVNGRTRVLALQPRLAVASLASSCSFYRDVLGFECTGGEPCDAEGFAIIRRDGIGIQLVTPSPGDSAPRITLWLQVADAAAEHERVRHDVSIEWGPEVYWYGCREFAVLDPDGHRIIFSSPTDEAPTCSDDGS